MFKKISVIVVDDSAFMRATLTAIINSDPGLEVVVSASDPIDAREKIKQYNPDVMTLDIQMPRMDGLSFLEKVMQLRPMPVLMISTLTEKGAKETINALALGAIDYVTKPQTNIEENINSISHEICQKIKIAYHAKVQPRTNNTAKPKLLLPNLNVNSKIIAIGSSTGGVEALSTLIADFPERFPPVLIVQHMPEKFTSSFAQRLDRSNVAHVVEAKDGMPVKPSTIYIAPGGYQMKIEKQGGGFCIALDNKIGNVSGHMPSADVLFESFAQNVPANKTIAVILTGMGRDGAKGMKMLHDLGAYTIGQNEDSCVVYGMPKAAKDLGAIDKEIHINEISTNILYSCV